MITPAEFIGTGTLWAGDIPDKPVAYPKPFPSGLAMGQHLAVERLVRVAENRLIYLVNNLSRKWKRKKCWACGNQFSPDKARCCSFCRQPLRDLRFLMTQRWNPDHYEGFETFAKARLRHLGLIAPVYAFYRHKMMMAVYHYDGGELLLDKPSPLPSTLVLGVALQLSETLAWLHEQGVVLRPFAANNVLLMPDGSARWFDLDVERIALRGAAELYRDPAQPPLRDVKNLADLLARYVSPDDEQLVDLVDGVRDGLFPGPIPLHQYVRNVIQHRMREADHAKLSGEACAFSDVGLYRSNNEDAWGWRRVDERVTLYVVADGMGGHHHGQEAARLAVDALKDHVLKAVDADKLDATHLRKTIGDAFARANKAVYDERSARRVDMGTTLTAALVVDGHHVFVGHVGDTRAYLLAGGKLRQLTEDQTLAAELLADGRITAEQARTHKGKHILTQAIGGEPKLEEVQIQHVQARQGDRLLLCSDGLHGELSDAAIAERLGGWADRTKCVRELVRSAYTEGGHDNLTALTVDIV